MIPPSEDPNRLEVLVVTGLTVATSQTAMTIFEMVGDENGTLRELRDFNHPSEGQTTAESP